MQQARDYAEKVVDTLREAVIVLDHDLRVLSAIRAFFRMSGLPAAETVGKRFTEIGDSRWDISPLVELLRKTLHAGDVFEDFTAGDMVLNARRIDGSAGAGRQILLAFEVGQGTGADGTSEKKP